MSVFRRIGRIVILFLIPVFVLFIVNSVVNRHDHLIRGYIYSHSHPYQEDGSKSPYQNHSHSQLELIVLDLLSDLEILVSLIVLSLCAVSQPKFLALSKNERVLPIYRLLNLPPRAPPRFV